MTSSSVLPHGGGVAGVRRLVGEPSRQLSPASVLLRRRTAGPWLQADGCYSKASWVAVKASATGNIALARGWQTFARARGLGRRCTLHFRYDGGSTLYVRVFGEDGRRAGYCPEDDDRGREPSPGDDGEDSARVTGGAQGSPSFTGSSSSGDSSSSGRGQPPRRRTCLGGGSLSARRRASVKRERESA